MPKLANSGLLVYSFGFVMWLQNVNTVDSGVVDRYAQYLENVYVIYVPAIHVSSESFMWRIERWIGIILLDNHTVI